MAEEKKAEAAEQDADAGKAKAAESGTEESKGAADTVSREEYEKLQHDLDNFKRIEEERKGKEKKRQEELLKEQGKYKDLYDTATKENETMKAQLEKLNAVMQGMLDEELKGLPEEFDKTLIPEVDSHDKLMWLRKAKSIIVPRPTEEKRRGDGTPAPKPGEGLSGMRSIYNNPTSPKH